MQKWEHLLLEVFVKDSGGGFLPKIGIAYSRDIKGTAISEKLNSLGQDGWELVSVVRTDSMNSYITEAYMQYYFKRPISN